MNWHERYVHQAAWTQELRRYVFERCGWRTAHSTLEVGCGTGGILQDPAASGHGARPGLQLHGLDIDPTALRECCEHAPTACLTCGDATALPYPSENFNITYCHFLLLWVRQPIRALQEMQRVTVRSGYVLALAEPDYGARLDRPTELAWLGQRQNAALERKGAALRRGAELRSLFQEAGIRLIESGAIHRAEGTPPSLGDWDSEWQVLESDLAGTIDADEMKEVRDRYQDAWLAGRGMLSVPTYFAWGQV